jgi:hypothetical protein
MFTDTDFMLLFESADRTLPVHERGQAVGGNECGL